MRKLMFLAVTALLALPALAVAGSPPNPADQAAAVKQCSTQRGAMGLSVFKQTWGTNASRSNAFGKCVSHFAQLNEQDRSNAAAQCRTLRSGDPTTFASTYGTGRNAFGKCVSAKAKAAAAAQVQATINAAKSCSAERTSMGAVAFKAKYGNKSNAFGKCVSAKVKQSG